MKKTWAVVVLASLFVAGCAGTQANTAHGPYEGRCSFVRLEYTERLRDEHGADQYGPDAVAVVARYRFGDEPTDDGPLAVLFQVSRARLPDLNAHLAAHPTVLCDGEGGIQVPPFNGQPGTAVE